MSIRYLILAGEIIVDVAASISQDGEGIDATLLDGTSVRYGYNAGVTEAQPVAVALFPADYAPGRYKWAGNAFVALPPPPPPPDTAKRKKLSRNGFRNVVRAATAVGGDVGSAAVRLLAVEDGMRTSTDPLIRIYYQQFIDAEDIDFEDMEPVWQILAAQGLYSAGEIAAIKAAWPKV